MGLKSLCVVAVSVCLVSQAISSAIPMWEFLSRTEKANRLFYIYKKQVIGLCHTSSSPDCSKNYMITGIQTIANMKEHEIDNLDPSQRGAKDLIWSKLSGNAASSREVQEPDNLFHTNDADYQGKEEIIGQDFYNTHVDNIKSHQTGPVAVRVLPDGRPVPGDEHTPAPKDDDLEDLHFEKLPIFEHKNQKHYKRPYLYAYVYSTKPIRYSKNYMPVTYQNYGWIFNEKGLYEYFKLNDIPRYNHFYTTSKYRY